MWRLGRGELDSKDIGSGRQAFKEFTLLMFLNREGLDISIGSRESAE